MIALDVQISTGQRSLVTNPDPSLGPPINHISQIALDLRLHYRLTCGELAAHADGRDNFCSWQIQAVGLKASFALLTRPALALGGITPAPFYVIV